jgi:hypothetical protein
MVVLIVETHHTPGRRKRPLPTSTQPPPLHIILMVVLIVRVHEKRPVASGGPQVRVAVITWKGYSTLQMVYSFTPPGVETITMSPILWPSSALPTGDSLEISPAAGLASKAPTRV